MNGDLPGFEEAVSDIHGFYECNISNTESESK